MNRPPFWLWDFASHTPFSGVEKITQSSWHLGEYNAAITSSLKFSHQCSTPIMSFVVGRWTLTHLFSTTTVKIFNDKVPKIGQYALEYSITTIQIFFNDKTKILQRHDILHQQAFLLLKKSWLCRFRDFQRQDMLSDAPVDTSQQAVFDQTVSIIHTNFRTQTSLKKRC